mgnify:CR=1 FL=1
MIVRPPVVWRPARTFGIPRGAPGRHSYTIQGIVLHCVSRPMEQSSADTGRVYRDNRARAEHASLHYVINERGAIQQNVADANIAWSMLRYDSNFPAPYPLPGITWTVADDNPGVTPDYYVLSIGVEQPSDNRTQGCTGCEELAVDETRAALVHLLAWLCQEHSIPVTDEFIVLHRDIDEAATGECGECVHLLDIITEVAAYCQPCEAPYSNYAPPGEITRLIGLSDPVCGNRCLVHEDVIELLQRLLPLAPNGGLVWLESGLALLPS